MKEFSNKYKKIYLLSKSLCIWYITIVTITYLSGSTNASFTHIETVNQSISAGTWEEEDCEQSSDRKLDNKEEEANSCPDEESKEDCEKSTEETVDKSKVQTGSCLQEPIENEDVVDKEKTDSEEIDSELKDSTDSDSDNKDVNEKEEIVTKVPAEKDNSQQIEEGPAPVKDPVLEEQKTKPSPQPENEETSKDVNQQPLEEESSSDQP